MRITSTPFLLDVGATPANQRLYNDGPGTVYYKSDSSVSSSSNDGSVAVGASVAVAATQWIAAAAGVPANVRLVDLGAGTVGTGIAAFWTGDWDSATVYTAGQIVAAGGGSYVALHVNTNVDPETDDGSTWALLASPGSPGAAGSVGVTLSEDKGTVGGSVTWDNAGSYDTLWKASLSSNLALTISNQPNSGRILLDLTPNSHTLTIVGYGAITLSANTRVFVDVAKMLDGALLVAEVAGSSSAAVAGTMVAYSSLTITTGSGLSAGGSAVPWDNEISDTQAMHSASGSTVTIPAAAGTSAMAFVTVQLAVNITAGTRTIQLRKNGTAIRPPVGSFETDGSNSRKYLSTQLLVASADTIDVFYSGSAATSVAGETNSVFNVAVFTLPA